MRFRIRTFMAVMALACTGSIASAVDIYVLENAAINLNSTPTNFGRIDTATGVYTQIASLNFVLSNLAWNQSAGNFFAVEGAGINATLRTLTTTGTLSASLGTIGRSLYGMAYRTLDSTLYGISYDGTSQTGSINPANGTWTSLNTNPGIGNMNPPAGARGTIMNDTWYVGGNYSPAVGIGTIAYTAGATYQQIGANAFFNMMSITNDGTTMYGIWDNGNPSGSLYTINTATGASTFVRSITGFTGGNIHGAAIITVPEPATWLLGGIATGAIGLVARRRKSLAAM